MRKRINNFNLMKKELKPKDSKPEEPLSLYGMDFDKVIDIALNTNKPAK